MTTTQAADQTASSDEPGMNDPALELLKEHVPLSLIVDLTDPTGPDSKQILNDEGLPEQQWWLPVQPPKHD